jgi:hypothetical protein
MSRIEKVVVFETSPEKCTAQVGGDGGDGGDGGAGRMDPRLVDVCRKSHSQ